MSLSSKICYPKSSHFVRAYTCIVRAVGKDAAVVLSEIDFYDQVHEQRGVPVVTRARLVAALQGIIGRNNVDKALSVLVGRDWVKKIEMQAAGQNLQTWHEYALNPGPLNAFLASLPSPASLIRESRVPGPGVPDLVPNPGKPYKKEIEASFLARAREPAAAKKNQQKSKSARRGPIIENKKDADGWAALLNEFGEAAAMKALETTTAGGNRQYVSNAEKILKGNQHGKFNTPPAALGFDDILGFDADESAQRACLAELRHGGNSIEGTCNRI